MSEELRPPLMSPEQSEREWKESMNRYYAKFKECGRFDIITPNFQYREFVKLGLIKQDKNEMQAMMIRARKDVEEKIKVSRLRANSFVQRNALNAQIERFKEDKLEDRDNDMIKQQARWLALEHMFKTWKDETIFKLPKPLVEVKKKKTGYISGCRD